MRYRQVYFGSIISIRNWLIKVQYNYLYSSSFRIMQLILFLHECLSFASLSAVPHVSFIFFKSPSKDFLRVIFHVFFCLEDFILSPSWESFSVVLSQQGSSQLTWSRKRIKKNVQTKKSLVSGFNKRETV